MQVIRRAAAFAHSFVSINYDHATAVKYLVRPADEGVAHGAAALPVGGAGRGRSVGKVAGLFAAVLSVTALSGAPASEAAASAISSAARAMVNAIWVTPSAAPNSALNGAVAWSEPASLLLLATGFFGAALIVRRRRL